MTENTSKPNPNMWKKNSWLPTFCFDHHQVIRFLGKENHQLLMIVLPKVEFSGFPSGMHVTYSILALF